MFYIEGFWWDFRYLHFLRPTNLPRKQVLCLTCNKGLIVPFLSRFKNESRGSRKINLCLHGWIISREYLISTLSFKENDGKKILMEKFESVFAWCGIQSDLMGWKFSTHWCLHQLWNISSCKKAKKECGHSLHTYQQPEQYWAEEWWWWLKWCWVERYARLRKKWKHLK